MGTTTRLGSQRCPTVPSASSRLAELRRALAEALELLAVVRALAAQRLNRFLIVISPFSYAISWVFVVFCWFLLVFCWFLLWRSQLGFGMFWLITQH